MSVTVRPYRRGGWDVDIQWLAPDGTRRRDRKVVKVTSKSAAQRWGEARERELLVNGPGTKRKEVPTLEEFAPRFLDGHARANRQKPGGIAHKEVVLRVHLVPFLGRKKLDAITNEDVQRLTEISLKQNDEVKKISAWAAIIFAPTLVGTIYGMNFDSMPELHWHLGYPLALVMMFGVGFVLWAAFRRKGWLSSE